MEKRSDLIAYLALAAICFLWGTTYLALRIGVVQFPPFLFSTIRFLLAGPILILLVMIFGKVRLPGKNVIKEQAIGGLLMVTCGISIVTYAEVQISSGIAAVICSMMPIYVILINLFITKDERPNVFVIVGLAMGFAGILLIFSEHLVEFSNPKYLKSILLTFSANLCWAIGSVWTKKKNSGSNPFMNAGLQLFFGGIFLIPLSLLFDDYATIQWTTPVIFSLSYLVLIGSVAAYACYFYAIGKLPMTLVSLYAYINPVIAVLLGWLILSEKLNIKIAIAIAVTLTGIYLVNRGYQMKTQWKAQLSKS
jgi:drug/metabolite transporter (DMT)-like permease